MTGEPKHPLTFGEVGRVVWHGVELSSELELAAAVTPGGLDRGLGGAVEIG